MDELAAERKRMVEVQIVRRGLSEPRLLAAFEAVPRHLFVPAEYRSHAYEDRALPIGEEQTISQPYIVALMTGLLELQGNEKVLEVGTGSGYQAAILSRLAGEVYTIEFNPELARRARETLEGMGCNTLHCRAGDGSLGWPEALLFDGILVTAYGPRVPRPLLEQLAGSGRLVMPVGDRRMQELELWRRKGEGFEHRAVTPVAFVPLRGQLGWDGEK